MAEAKENKSAHSLRRRMVAAFLLTCLCIGQVAAQYGAVPDDAVVRDELNAAGVPAAAYALLGRDGRVHTRAFGQDAKGVAVTERTRFRAGSIGKTVLAMGILRLAEQGKVNLQAPVKDYLSTDWFENPFAPAQPLRVIHLLEHSSGFDEMHFQEWNDEGAVLSLDSALRINPRARRLRWPPGERPSYSNENYALLALLIREVTGQAWKSYLRDSILLPFGMTGSGYGMPPEPHVLGHSGEENDTVSLKRRYNLGPSIEFFTHARDMSVLLEILTGRRPGPLTPTSLARMGRVESTRAGRAGFRPGFGPGMECVILGDRLAYGHDGDLHGFWARYRIFPEDSAGFALLTNAESGASTGLSSLLAQICRGDDRRPAPVTVELPFWLRDAIPGYYRLCNPRNGTYAFADRLRSDMRLSWEGDSLRLAAWGGEGFTFLYMGDSLFRLSGMPEASLVAGRLPGGGAFVQVAGQYYERRSAFPSAWLRPLIGPSEYLLSGQLVLAVILLGLWFISWIRMRSAVMAVLLSAAPWLFLHIGVNLYADLSYEQVGTFNLTTLLIFLSSLLIPIFTYWGLHFSVRGMRLGPYRGLGAWAMFISLLNVVLCVYLFSFDLIGLALW